MDSVVKSFWFWLLIIGMALILTSILIAGGMKEMKGWTWIIFVVGAVLAVLGIIFGFVAWSKHKPCVENSSETVCSTQIEDCGCDTNSPSYSYSNKTTPQITKVSMNVPQAQRGFSATSVNLSSLAPES